jgi:superfamily II DNA or RNA helicase
VKVDLRDYQAAAFEQAREHIRNGARSVLINAPTGAGKTVLASAIMEMASQKGKRANFVVDRLSLIDQTSTTFDRYGLDHGVVQGLHPRYRPSMPIQVCSVQTVAKRGWPIDAELDVFDEAHVLHKAHKARIGQRRREEQGVVIGLTATPFTRGLAQYFDAVVNVTTTRKLIEAGWLSPYRVFSCAEPNMDGVSVKSTGEWDDREASSRALEVVGDVVAEYFKHGEGRKFICSAVDTAHVEELQRQFLAAGINVATYTYKDREEDRADTTLEFRKPNSSIRGLITVTAASRGFDVADVSCIIMARPLRKSLAEHIQLFGRGLRISPETGKQNCLVLDHSGNMARFWQECEEFFDFGIDELDDGKPKKKAAEKPKKEPEPVKCPQCRAIHKPMPFCPCCGHEYPKKAAVQHVPGTLKELVATGDASLLRRELWPQIAYYAVETCSGDMERAQRKAQAIYRDITGEFCKARVETTERIPPSREVANKIRANFIRWAKGRASSQRETAHAI